MTWVEGLPTEPGTYWFFVVDGPRSRTKQGRSFYSGNGVLLHVDDDFLYAREFEGPLRRVWHMPLVLPAPPEFDATCPSCKDGKRFSWSREPDCIDCRGTGKLGSPPRHH